MAEQIQNNYSTRLNGAIDNDDTTIVVHNAPAMTGEFRIRIDSEIILVGTVSGTTFSGCTRGAEGTTAAFHADNARVLHILTKGALEAFSAASGGAAREFPASWTLDDVDGDELIIVPGNDDIIPAEATAVGTFTVDNMPGIDLVLDAGEGFYVPCPAGDVEVLLHFSDTYDFNGMFGLAFVDNSGNGHCFVQYQNNLYQMNVAAYNYSGTGFNVSASVDLVNTFGHQWIAAKRVGTTLTGRISLTGTGLSAATTGVTNNTATRIFVGRFYNGNGGKPVRIHRLTIGTPNLGV